VLLNVLKVVICIGITLKHHAVDGGCLVWVGWLDWDTIIVQIVIQGEGQLLVIEVSFLERVELAGHNIEELFLWRHVFEVNHILHLLAS
jgi:hypothetical protein